MGILRVFGLRAVEKGLKRKEGRFNRENWGPGCAEGIETDRSLEIQLDIAVKSRQKDIP